MFAKPLRAVSPWARSTSTIWKPYRAFAGRRGRAFPVILQVSNGARQYAGRGYLRKMAEAASEETDVPFVLHLDHGSGFDICKACIDDGFTSVMIDGSHLPFEENVAVTRRVVEYAHDRGVWVEAELGRLAGVEETVSSRKSVYTDPEEAETFVARTGCDSLAIAIGTSHGPCKFSGEARLDFERLDAIAARLPGVPLVLHGASSVPQEAVGAINARRECSGNLRRAEDLLPPRRRFRHLQRSILIRICGWPSPPPSGPCLRSAPKPSILAPI